MKAAVVRFPGTNGDRDVFEALSAAGFEPEFVSSSRPLSPEASLVAFPGGFSFGDFWRAGALARHEPAVLSVRSWLRHGGLCIGICNGFQILAEAGLLNCALAVNTPAGFRHGWAALTVEENSSPWFGGIAPGTTLRLPYAHGEGRVVFSGREVAQGEVPLRYVETPNGSELNAAAVVDSSGRILGLMPHPERAFTAALRSDDGLRLFRSAHAYLTRRVATAPATTLPLRDNEAVSARAPVTTPAPAFSLTPRAALNDVATLPRDEARELGRTVGLDADELTRIETELKRTPSRAELLMFGAMWSEHCSYKSSRHLLASLPKEGRGVLAGPGSHAGVVDVGDGFGVAFKIESHNHPSAVEPYQGAATGVGGILRDVIAQGARPVAILDGLCFGNPDSAQARHIREGVVAGIGGYGNAVGVANVGGRTRYDARYEKNPLVNAMAVGLLHPEQMRTARATGTGHALLYVGAATGSDGVMGAAFASETLGKDTSNKRTHVQVGDPFTGKKLLEACLSFSPEQGLLACQDLGAAGLACAVTEMADASGVGLRLQLDAVPLRDSSLTPEEIFVSETQERFAFIVKKTHVDAAVSHFRDAGLEARVVGETIAGGRVEIAFHDTLVADVPASLVAGGPGAKRWPAAPLPPPPAWPAFQPRPVAESLLGLLATPSLRDDSEISRGFDQTVGNLTARGPGDADAAVLRLPGSSRGVALCITGDGPQCSSAPRLGAQAAIAESMRRLACAGAELVAITDGLNQGAPNVPTEAERLREVIGGLGDALRFFGVPVTGGNVSLYNQSAAGPVPPTPLVGALGVTPDVVNGPTHDLRSGQRLFLAGPWSDAVGHAHYGSWASGALEGPAPEVDLGAEKRLAAFLGSATRAGLVPVARSVNAGGLLVALAKLCARTSTGAKVKLPAASRIDWALFGEHPAQAWLAVRPDDAPRLRALAAEHGCPLFDAGEAGGDALELSGVASVRVSDIRRALGTERAS